VHEFYTSNGYTISNELEQQFEKRNLYDAKEPGQLFTKDSEREMPAILNEAYHWYKQLDSVSAKILQAG
jgi:hypothetical protein